jgi:chemotaxis protein histidine kinase CheA
MAPKKPPQISVETYTDHQVITQPNPLRAMVHYVEDKDFDDPVARAEQALADLSGEFKDWMRIECDRLSAAHAAIKRDGVNKDRQDEMFRAAHDVKGHAATFGYPTAAAAAESLTRIIEHAPDLAKVPEEIITHHINAILAIFREQNRRDDGKAETADELSKRLRNVADEYLVAVNQDRPEHLEAILAPSIAPTE